MVQTAVHPIQEFCQVKSTDMLLKAHTKKGLGYKAYTSLFLSTTSDCDSKNVATRGIRQVYANDTVDRDGDEFIKFLMMMIHSNLTHL
jgi:hypothetical protein